MERRRVMTGWRIGQGASGILVLWMLLAAQVFAPRRAQSAEKLIWQIGKPDHASLEFNPHWDFSQAKDPRFIVGQSNPAQDWSAFHPGIAASGADQRPHPFTILFSLDDDPRGVYYLTVDAMFRSPGIPEYFIEVNGKKGRFYFSPQLTYETGDPETAWNIIFSVQSVRVALPAAYFRKGENQIVLTCGADEGRVLLPNSKASSGTLGIYYDALALAQDSEVEPAALMPTASAMPTIFYRRQSNDKLSEIVILQAMGHGRYERGSATLKLEKEKLACPFTTGYDFGESECAVEVPELAGPTPARLTVTLGNQSITRKVSLAPQKKWKLFLCPQMHLDMGYTDYRPNSYEVHDRNIDQIIATLEARPDYKFNPDGSFILEEYWKHRGEEWRERCLKVLREGRLALPAQLFTINSGLASQEELYQLAYFSARFSREHNLPLVYADQTDVPAHSWALPSILSSMGLKYLAIASNPFRGPILLHGRLHEESPFWWEGPDGRKILTWFSRQYAQLEQLFTRQPNALAGVNSLPIFLQAYGSPAYDRDAVMLYGTQSDNVPFAPEEVGFPDQWNKEFAYPEIRTSTMVEFFQYMERGFANSLATLKGDGGAWWEEMAAADAFYAGMARKAKERALAGEVAASIGSIVNPGFQFPLMQDEAIWNNLLLYTEHTWGTPRAWYRPESDAAGVLLRDKESFSRQAEIETDHLLRRGLSQLADKVYTKGDTLVIFNPLSWVRGGLVEVELDRGQGLIDSTTRHPVPLELIRRDKDEEYDRVRFWVDEVPPLGFHLYEIASSGSATPASDLAVSNSFENEFYKVVVDPSRGGIASILDKQLGKELVDDGSHYTLDQYVYAGYGHEGSSLIQQRTRFNSTLLQYSTALPLPGLDVSTAGQGKVVGARKAPWGTILIFESSAAHTPKIETELRLFDKAKRVDLVNTVQKEIVRAPEGVYFAFPFAGARPVIRYEIQDAWVDPARDQLPGANKEWFSGQHWIAVTNPSLSIALAFNEAPLFTIGDIDRGRWPETLEVTNGTIFSYIMDNYDGDDERPFQGGTYTFQYTLSSSREFDPAELARFGREAASPLEFERVTRAAKHDSPPEPLTQSETGFIAIDGKEVVLSTWKAADDGEGYILRFYNTTDSPTTARVGLPNLQFDRVFRVNGLQVNQEAVVTGGADFTLSFAAHEIVSVKIMGLKLR
jgi:alpha-mannosidase